MVNRWFRMILFTRLRELSGLWAEKTTAPLEFLLSFPHGLPHRLIRKLQPQPLQWSLGCFEFGPMHRGHGIVNDGSFGGPTNEFKACFLRGFWMLLGLGGPSHSYQPWNNETISGKPPISETISQWNHETTNHLPINSINHQHNHWWTIIDPSLTTHRPRELPRQTAPHATATTDTGLEQHGSQLPSLVH